MDENIELFPNPFTSNTTESNHMIGPVWEITICEKYTTFGR